MGQIKMEKHFSSYEKMEMAGRTILVPGPDRIEGYDLVGREEEINKALAAWSTFDDIPALHFRLYGPPGVGKNAIVNELAKILNRDLYVMNGNEDMRAEDIACTPVQASNGEIHYVASPLFAAMLRGAIFFFDEIGKAPRSALDPLASVLDERLTLTSVMAGIRLRAKPGFLFCAALNDIEEDGIGLPGFLDERIRPAIQVRYQSIQEIEAILKTRKPMIPADWAERLVAEYHNIPLSAREAINLLQYAYNKFNREKTSRKATKTQIKTYLHLAFPEVVSRENLEKNNEQNVKKGKLHRNIEVDCYDQEIFRTKKTLH